MRMSRSQGASPGQTVSICTIADKADRAAVLAGQGRPIASRQQREWAGGTSKEDPAHERGIPSPEICTCSHAARLA